MVDLVILTALPVEFAAVSQRLTSRREHLSRSNAVFEIGTYHFEEKDFVVALGEIGAGLVTAATETAFAISEFEPTAAIFVGVAGGIKDVKVGDIVVATKVYGYESGKEDPSGFRPRPDVSRTSYAMDQEARALGRGGQWWDEESVTTGQRLSPTVHVAPICAGEKVVASTRSSTYTFIRRYYSDAVAVEMEGRGFLEPARHLEVNAAIVRGISDLIDLKSASDAAGTQQVASDRAAEFALRLGARFITRRSPRDADVHSTLNPYRGLRYFDIGDASMFFGREREIEKLLFMLHDSISLSRPRLVGILGASGSGKSSVARAGLLAELLKGAFPGSEKWRTAVLRPGPNPLSALAQMMTAENEDASQEELVHRLTEDERTLDTFADKLDAERFVLLIDQLEEVFTLCADTAVAEAFLKCLVYAAQKPRGKVCVLLTLRSDQYHRCADYSEFAAVVATNHLLLGPLTDSALHSAISSPADAARGGLEPGLTERILRDCTAVAGPLPLLQYALEELWRKSVGGQLRHSDYSDMGGLDGAMIERAEAAYLSLNIEEKAACKALLLRISLYEGTIDTRQPMQFSEIVPDGAVTAPYSRVVEVFAGQTVRLLVVDQDELGEPLVELTHESLLTNWPRLREWLEEDREAHAFYSQLSRDARAWHTNGRPAEQLMTAERLKLASDWLTNDSRVPLSRNDKAYLDVSVAAQVRRLIEASDTQVAVELARFQQSGQLLTQYARSMILETVSDSATRRLRLALLAVDRDQVQMLREDLLVVTATEVSVLLEAIGDRVDDIAEFMWSVVMGETNSDSSRIIRAAAVLARAEPQDSRWVAFAPRLVEAILTEGTSVASQWFILLKPVQHVLVSELGRVAQERHGESSHRATAAAGVAVLCASAETLADIMIGCEGSAHDELFAALRRLNDLEPAVEVLRAWSAASHAVDSEAVNRRATALADAIHLGFILDIDLALGEGCPESVASRFVDLAQTHALPLDHLWEAFGSATTSAARRRLILALGSREREGTGDFSKRDMVPVIRDLSRQAKESGLRAAAEWALTNWGELPSVERLGVAEYPYGAEYFTLNCLGEELRFVRFDAGSFTMGSPQGEYRREDDEHLHTVGLTAPFVLLDRPISQRLLDTFRQDQDFGVRDRHESSVSVPSRHAEAASNVTWLEANALADWLPSVVASVSAESPASIFRLPTEAEWEFACRAGTDAAFSFGPDLDLLPKHAWFVDNAPGGPQEPGRLIPNPRGLFDMHGNVYEWCSDWYGPYSLEPSLDPQGPSHGDRRVVRGGCWFFEARFCRSAYRGDTRDPGNEYIDVGFRLACTLDSFVKQFVPGTPTHP